MSDPTDPDQELSDEDQVVWDEYAKTHKQHDLSPDKEENFASLLDDEIDFIDSKEEEKSKIKITKSQISKAKKNADSNFQIDRRTEEKLKKGKLPIDGKIDLHGMTQDIAHEALVQFIDDALLNGKRCVLVITGKGKAKSTSEDWLVPEQGILKKQVPEWLSVPPLNKNILKFYLAQPKHGGSGALYVYLRRY